MKIADKINKLTLQLAEEHDQKYKEWCRENPGKIMNGHSIMSHALKMASFAKNLSDLKAMKRHCEICYEAMKGQFNGWGFSVRAMDELIELVKKK